MMQRSRMALTKALKVLDILCLLSTALLMLYVTDIAGERIDFAEFLSVRISIYNCLITFASLSIWHVIFLSQKLYMSRRLSSLPSEIVDVIKATTVGTITLYPLCVMLRIPPSPLFLLTFWANVTGMIVTNRIILRYALKRFRLRGRNLRNIVIAGINNRSKLFAREILSRPEYGYRLLGFVDEANERSAKLDEAEYGVVANFGNFAEYLRQQVVDEVMVCLPIRSHYQEAAHIAAICEEHGIIVRFLSDLFNPKLAHSTIQQFEGHPIITFYTGHMMGGGAVVKHIMDFTLAVVLIVTLSPLFVLAALSIKLTSRGPIFFVQKRLGLNKRRFHLYKFRTMSPEAEKMQAELETLNEVQGAAFKIKNDPRVTPVGRFLRKTSIDELPQLLNVLKGEMSLVGPRPLPIRDYQGFNKDWHRRRFSVRPGITCLWQISGRSDVSFDRWMELDMQYIDNWSLWLDLKILLGTIPAVLKGSGAS